MGIINGEIITNKSVNEIIDQLKKVTIEEQPFIKPKGIFFLGKISGNTFKLITFNSPPIDIEFTITDSLIKIKYQKYSLAPIIKGLIYGLLLPLLISLFIWGIINKHIGLSGKLALAILLLLPFLTDKIFSYLYNHFILKNDDEFFSQLEKILDVKIERNQEPAGI